MKLLIVSDIHGSAYYTKKMIEAYKRHMCDHIVLLGDILYHGPRNPLPKDYAPNIVLELLNEYKDVIIACRGNCDSEVDQMVLHFPITADYQVIHMKDYNIMLSHGHIYNPDHLPFMEDGDVFLYGHIHIPITEYTNKINIINPSSISLPKENNPHTYGVIEERTFTLYDVEHSSLKPFHIR